MRNVIDIATSAPARRRRLLRMAEKRRAVATRVRSKAEEWTLKALGIAARAGYVGFSIYEPNTGAPEDARRYLRASRRYDQFADHFDERADALEREANGMAGLRERGPAVL
jgi:hypothetical protein